MTTAALPRKAGPYQGNGVTTTFSYGFQVFAPGDIQVVRASVLGTETTLTVDVDYSVVVNVDQTNLPGGSITLIAGPLAVGEALAVVGSMSYSQPAQLPNGGAYNATTVERMVDRVTRLVQQVLEVADRGVQLAVTAAANVSGRLPAPTPLGLLGWNAAGTALQNFAGSASAMVSTFMTNVVAAADAATAQAALGASAVGRALFTSTDAAAARAAIGAQALGGAAATGGGTDQVFYLNGQTVNTTYSIPAGQNAMSAGPVTVANGVTVTVPNNSTWTVV